ncbi:hypothetical protein BBF96_13060 [Anoxybacter fermentans]|uniref:GP-PDE domain-containing protein n=1 Tax=Anoxybacter fermentans TaxID=1323375 RepID=A0A3Q9HTU5_9FIRM|nr:glycerophosphodiester phosphodiesterase [Anoxybacter fermentans]AZR74246.1 hypothetical protein BBF96_13060 [Anoxybacter fermentans]
MKEVKPITTQIIAHRGASGVAPENTLAAFRRAVQEGADGIEFDVHLTKDGEIVICHDETVDRTSNGMGYIYQLTLEELKRLDFGSWFSPEYEGEKILTLGEFFEQFAEYDFLINIEIKNSPIFYDGIEQKIWEQLQIYGLQEKVLVSSFYHRSLQILSQIAPSISLGVLCGCGPLEPWSMISGFQARSLNPNRFFVDRELIEQCHQMGYQVFTWTVNNKAEIKQMIEWQVDGIITNYPALARSIRDELINHPAS